MTVAHAAAHDEGPIGPPHVHHMDSKTAYESAKLGMWLFLATEILLFGGLFACFALYRWMYLEEFHKASLQLNRILGFTNTCVLLISSFTAAVAVTAAQKGNNKLVSKCLMFTIFCGFVFLVIKYFEYSAKFHHGFFPGTMNHETNALFGTPGFAKEYKAYFGLYYCMTGLHGLHVIFGMALLGWALKKSLKNRFSPDYYTPVEVSALYWHLVDLIWIYLFPLLYLVG